MPDNSWIQAGALGLLGTVILGGLVLIGWVVRWWFSKTVAAALDTHKTITGQLIAEIVRKDVACQQERVEFRKRDVDLMEVLATLRAEIKDAKHQ